jgi:hypothetical protein
MTLLQIRNVRIDCDAKYALSGNLYVNIVRILVFEFYYLPYQTVLSVVEALIFFEVMMNFIL